MTKEYPWGNGTLKSVETTTTIGAAGGVTLGTVPANKIWMMQTVTVDVTGSATVGNRILGIYITGTGGTNPVWLTPKSGSVAAAAIGGIDISFDASASSTTVRRARTLSADTAAQVNAYCSIRYLSAGQKIILDDYANIDNADAVVHYLSYVEYDA